MKSHSKPSDADLNPPPSYTEAIQQNAPPQPQQQQTRSASLGHQQHTHMPASSSRRTSAPATHVSRQFPPSFNMYNVSSFMDRRYVLGEHQDRPLYALSFHSGFSGQPDLVLHNGPTEDHPVLAAFQRESFSSSAIITLPPPPGCPGTRTGAEERLEPASSGFGSTTYVFTIETGPGNRRETFEWRHSRGGAVSQLGGKTSGWKLVRLATGPPSGLEGPGQGGGSSSSAATFVGGGDMSSDGKEVVAAWCWAVGSITKKLKFQFLGSGRTPGVLGERWAIMAVVSALRIWEHERRQKEN